MAYSYAKENMFKNIQVVFHKAHNNLKKSLVGILMLHQSSLDFNYVNEYVSMIPEGCRLEIS